MFPAVDGAALAAGVPVFRTGRDVAQFARDDAIFAKGKRETDSALIDDVVVVVAATGNRK